MICEYFVMGEVIVSSLVLKLRSGTGESALSSAAGFDLYISYDSIIYLTIFLSANS